MYSLQRSESFLDTGEGNPYLSKCFPYIQLLKCQNVESIAQTKFYRVVNINRFIAVEFVFLLSYPGNSQSPPSIKFTR